MVVEEVAGKWHTVSRAGKRGKRGFTTRASAEAAQARGRALASGVAGSAPAGVPDVSTGGIGFSFRSFTGYRSGVEKAGVVHSTEQFDEKGKSRGKKPGKGGA